MSRSTRFFPAQLPCFRRMWARLSLPISPKPDQLRTAAGLESSVGLAPAYPRSDWGSNIVPSLWGPTFR